MTVFFVIACLGRTGSTMLASMLDSHPDIECRGELFGPEGAFRGSGLSRGAFLDGPAFLTERPIKGFKMPYDWTIEYPGIYDDFRARGYKVLHLYRDDLLSHFVSAALAEINGRWGSNMEHPEQRLVIDPWSLVEFAGSRYTATRALKTMAAGLEMLDVRFEDLVDPASHPGILSFLGASPASLVPSTVRARTLPNHEAIENYDELGRLFDGSRYGPWFPKVGPDA